MNERTTIIRAIGERDIPACISILRALPELVRAGLGTRLISQVEADAKKKGATILHTKTPAASKVDPHFAETRAFWPAQGFVAMEETDLWETENPCLILVKPL